MENPTDKDGCGDYLLLHFPPFVANRQSCPASHAQPCDCPPLHHPLVTIYLSYPLGYPTLVMYPTSYCSNTN